MGPLFGPAGTWPTGYGSVLYLVSWTPPIDVAPPSREREEPRPVTAERDGVSQIGRVRVKAERGVRARR